MADVEAVGLIAPVWPSLTERGYRCHNKFGVYQLEGIVGKFQLFHQLWRLILDQYVRPTHKPKEYLSAGWCPGIEGYPKLICIEGKRYSMEGYKKLCSLGGNIFYLREDLCETL